MNPFKKVARYLHNVAVGADQEANVILGGKPDETISSRAQRAADKGNPLGEVVSDGLDLIQKDHGHKAMHGDLNRAEDIVTTETDALKGK